MSNDIEIRVTSTDLSGPGLTKAKDNTEKIGPAAKKSSTELENLGKEFQRTATDSDNFGRSLNGQGSFSEFLSRKLVSLQQDAKKLGEEFNRTGSSDPLKALRNNQSLQDDIKKVTNDLANALGDAGATGGKEFAKNFSSSAQGVESTPVIGPAIVAGIITAIVAAAPLIGATIDGALLAGIGLGGVALGVVGQLKDPEVHNAIADMGNDLMTTLSKDTAPFKQPLLDAIGIVKGSATHMLDSIDFSKVAGQLVPLANGVSMMFAKVEPGLEKALDSPALLAFADELPGLGDAVGSFFDSLDSGSEGGSDALRTLMKTIDGTIIVVGDLIEFLSKLYAGLLNAATSVTGFLKKISNGNEVLAPFFGYLNRIFTALTGGGPSIDGVARSLHGLGATAQLSQDDLNSLAGQINEVKTTADTLAASMVNKLFTATMSVDQTTNAWHTSLTSLHDTLEQNGLAIDRHTHQIADNTKAGEQNRQAIFSVISANMAQYQANIAAGMSAQDAARQYDGNTAALEKQMRQAGYTQSAIDGIVGKYADIPDVVNTQIATKGLQDAIDGLGELLAEINGIQDQRYINIQARARIDTNFGHNAVGSIWGGGATWVGESGRELVNLPTGSRVNTAGDSQRLAGASMGQSSVATAVDVNFVGNTDVAFSQAIMKLIRDGVITILPRAVR
jgi:hypothetical protein